MADRALPIAQLPRRTIKHHQAKLDDEAGLLGDVDEFHRGEPAKPRMIPAGERFEAGDTTAL